jgi:GMP synthase-like glutamine amidotransferase
MRVLAVTHGPTVRAELFGDVVREAGHELVEWEIAERGAPRATGYDAVIVFGGQMNVGEELEHPWLRDEYELLRSWVEEETPLLGICLGAQTLAHASGAEVTKLPAPQVGFVDVELTDAGRDDPLLGVYPERFPALFGNEYRFALPEAAVDLARANGRSQAYRLGPRAWAVQFHPEARRDQVLRWWSNGRTLPKPLDELAADVDAEIARWHERGRALCLAFLAEARSADRN